ncbi:MAG: exodeoxyribonuclease VII large subunit [Hespellia sp.]|nr:exodeoxyribonuclease VII large subunit [Hespellia sp.]
MQNVYSVKQVNAYIKNMFTQDYMLSRIYVKGEVSNCKYHSSGHIYFSLKDESGTIACIMFAGQRSGLSFRLSEGQQVIVLGNVSTYERGSNYQLYAKEIILDGAGLLYQRFEALKKELAEMGMFSEEYKQPIPTFAKRIGIVTAPTGAAIRDIINVSSRRNPYVQLILYPALVQGDGAAESIVSGIHALEYADVDVIIVGRGGGSMEDLWAFNEECVARAIFECKIPIISAVGHETDTTISDYVADLRAPTPSAAAELAVYEYLSVEARINEYQSLIQKLMLTKLQLLKNQGGQYAVKLKYLNPRQKLNEKRQQSMEIENRLRQLLSAKIERTRHTLAIYVENMRRLSPLDKLNQGFSYVENQSHQMIKSIRDVAIDEELFIYMTDGSVRVKVTETKKEEYHGGTVE